MSTHDVSTNDIYPIIFQRVIFQRMSQARLGGYAVAYHGSSPENFHSILNTGLRVMSGSRLMKNGAAFGHGV